MDGNADSIFLAVEYLKSVVHVGAFLRRNALDALVMDGNVTVSCDLYIETADGKNITQFQQYTEVYALFGNSLRRNASAVYAAMWQLNKNSAAFGGFYYFKKVNAVALRGGTRKSIWSIIHIIL